MQKLIYSLLLCLLFGTSALLAVQTSYVISANSDNPALATEKSEEDAPDLALYYRQCDDAHTAYAGIVEGFGDFITGYIEVGSRNKFLLKKNCLHAKILIEQLQTAVEKLIQCAQLIHDDTGKTLDIPTELQQGLIYGLGQVDINFKRLTGKNLSSR